MLSCRQESIFENQKTDSCPQETIFESKKQIPVGRKAFFVFRSLFLPAGKLLKLKINKRLHPGALELDDNKDGYRQKQRLDEQGGASDGRLQSVFG